MRISTEHQSGEYPAVYIYVNKKMTDIAKVEAVTEKMVSYGYSLAHFEDDYKMLVSHDFNATIQSMKEDYKQAKKEVV